MCSSVKFQAQYKLLLCSIFAVLILRLLIERDVFGNVSLVLMAEGEKWGKRSWRNTVIFVLGWKSLISDLTMLQRNVFRENFHPFQVSYYEN
jgi:hypothetical protein